MNLRAPLLLAAALLSGSAESASGASASDLRSLWPELFGSVPAERLEAALAEERGPGIFGAGTGSLPRACECLRAQGQMAKADSPEDIRAAAKRLRPVLWGLSERSQAAAEGKPRPIRESRSFEALAHAAAFRSESDPTRASAVARLSELARGGILAKACSLDALDDARGVARRAGVRPAP